MLRRYRGVLTVAVFAALVAGWLLVTDPLPSTSAAPPSTVRVANDADLPTEVVPWSVAERQGRTDDLEWGERCDTNTGRLALPVPSPPECYATFSGNNGGATSPGVTATSVRVVVYRGNRNDTLAALAQRLLGTTSDPGALTRFQRGLVDLYQRYYELYGRTIEVVEFEGTGAAGDAVAAVADAETIARDIRPFAVLGGPTLTNAFADTLAARKVVCIACTPGQPDRFYAERDPYVWDLLKNPEQNGYMVNEYVGKRLAGRPAKFAGDPALRAKERVFGSVHIELGADTREIAQALEDDLARYGVRYAVEVPFAGPTELTATGRDLITRLKDAGVTTIVYTGDPLAPATLTKIATEQGYFPEWVITGTALIDTTVLGRTYDQRQWAHAFGPANLFVRDPRPRGAAELWQWFYGEPSPVPGAAASGVAGSLQVLFLGLQATGADVTPQRFRDTLFRAPTFPPTPTLGQISFGERGYFENPDYTAVDDQTEVWWDPEAEAVDELGRSGRGAWRFVDGGKRILPGKWPKSEPKVFDRSNSVVELESSPPYKDYPPVR